MSTSKFFYLGPPIPVSKLAFPTVYPLNLTSSVNRDWVCNLRSILTMTCHSFIVSIQEQICCDIQVLLFWFFYMPYLPISSAILYVSHRHVEEDQSPNILCSFIGKKSALFTSYGWIDYMDLRYSMFSLIVGYHICDRQTSGDWL